MAEEIVKYVRIRPPVNKSEDLPRSFTTSGVTIRQADAGTAVKDAAVVKRLKSILGEIVEVSNTPFEVKRSGKGFVIEPGKKE